MRDDEIEWSGVGHNIGDSGLPMPAGETLGLHVSSEHTIDMAIRLLFGVAGMYREIP